MRPLRIALTTGNWISVVDGVALTLARTVARLRDDGHRVLVLAPGAARPALPAGIDFVPLPALPVPAAPGYRLALCCPGSLARRLSAFAPDLVHLATPDLVGWGALRWAEGRRVPVVASFHTNFPSYLRYVGPTPRLEPALWWLARRFYGRCRHVYVPSASMAAELSRRGVEGELRLWSRGVDRDLFSPARRSEGWRALVGARTGEPVVLFVGRLRREKGVERLADLLLRLGGRGPAHRAVIVGSGPAESALRARLPRVRFCGHLEGSRLAEAYASADVFLQPSDTETFGNVTLEAMASGLPVVGLDAPGSRCLVEPGVSGLLAGAGGLAAAAERLLRAPQERRRMGEQARQRSAAYSWDDVLDQLVGHYAELVA